jgi:RNA:NAD 2'-phosphotransferase (TPT1/KptA family)
MAKKGGNSKGVMSAGIHSNVKSSILNASRREYLASGERHMNQLASWRLGKNVVLTIDNPNKNETGKRFIRVNARDAWGDPRAKKA